MIATTIATAVKAMESMMTMMIKSKSPKQKRKLSTIRSIVLN